MELGILQTYVWQKVGRVTILQTGMNRKVFVLSRKNPGSSHLLALRMLLARHIPSLRHWSIISGETPES